MDKIYCPATSRNNRMSVESTPVLRKQQSKLPTSMRYERVQDILEHDFALRSKLGPKNHEVDTRFGEKLLVSKETVEVTEAIHAEGKDAHKVPKNEILKMAAKVMKVFPQNGDVRIPSPSPVEPGTVVQVSTEPETDKKQKAKPAAKTKSESSAKAEPSGTKTTVVDTKAKQAKKQEKTDLKTTKLSKSDSQETDDGAGATAEIQRPESELPPEKQPLRLPAEFDPTKYPHYSVQSSVYSLLLSALNLSVHFEKFPGFEERQKKLEMLIKDYQETCDPIRVGA